MSSISHIVSVTNTPSIKFPGISNFIASHFKLEKIHCINLNLGCTGYVDALTLAYDIINFNKSCKVLIVTSDTYSKFINFGNKSIRSLFSDGASAFVLNHKNIELIEKSYGFLKNTGEKIVCEYNQDLSMNGIAIYDFTMASVLPNLISFIEKSKKKIDRIYLHQGSKFIIKHFQTKLSKYCKHIPENISLKGNLVSATIPHLINDDLIKKPLKNEEVILICGFGVGLAYKMILLKVGEKK